MTGGQNSQSVVHENLCDWWTKQSISCHPNVGDTSERRSGAHIGRTELYVTGVVHQSINCCP